MADRTDLTHRSTGRVTLGEFVRRELPHLHIASISQPEPELARHNVVAATQDIDAARAAVLELEALEADDAKLGFVVLVGRQARPTATSDAPTPSASPGRWQPGPWSGGAIGALVGALLIGGATALFASGSTALVAALSGAFFGGVVRRDLGRVRQDGRERRLPAELRRARAHRRVHRLAPHRRCPGSRRRTRSAGRPFLAHDRRRRQQRHAHAQSAMTTTEG